MIGRDDVEVSRYVANGRERYRRRGESGAVDPRINNGSPTLILKFTQLTI